MKNKISIVLLVLALISGTLGFMGCSGENHGAGTKNFSPPGQED